MVRALVFVFLAGLVTSASAAEPTGREIMNTQQERLELRDEERVMSMDLVDPKGKIRQRKVRMWNMRTAGGTEKLMLVFLSPRDVEGTGLLTWEQRDRDDDQWLFLPSANKEKRIAPGAKKNRFMGTEFTFEDLRSESLDRHVYRLTGVARHEDQDCYVVEATPDGEKEARESGYGKRILWIAKDTYVTLRVEYFDKTDRKIKILENGDVVRLEGTIVRPDHSVMRNLRTNGETRMKVVERKFNQGLDAQMFTLRKLRSL